MNVVWDLNEVMMAAIGGVIIGVAVSLMLLWNGRVTGISGIIGHSLKLTRGDWYWRVAFTLGLFLGGVVMLALSGPERFIDTTDADMGTTIIAGLLVGFGTLMGSGCTSGHGVCGLSRFSPRSLVATLSFMASGFVLVAVVRAWFGGN
ncbi:MAG TPA: YeeE/YedE family protein [Pseudobdellovibrionaceae bacterium]|nr:YeeE/YedE family protein [Pseudobdellovibrionaceae bacterium]